MDGIASSPSTTRSPDDNKRFCEEINGTTGALQVDAHGETGRYGGYLRPKEPRSASTCG
jgi:hypothetical protein